MADMTICDECGKDISKETQFDAEIYNHKIEEVVIKVDLCEKCSVELCKKFPKAK
ncbi:MAG TPA: hypothetical protein VMW10_08020 [Alphaproteobacteria bacterium]|nr:hypothetical protein [Alphaproteobacteria bacterium]